MGEWAGTGKIECELNSLEGTIEKKVDPSYGSTFFLELLDR